MDIEDELAKILQQEDLDNRIIEKLKHIKQQSTDNE